MGQSKLDREVQSKIQSLSETTPCDPSHAAEIETWQRALRWQQGEEVPPPDAIPGQCRDC